MGRIGAAVARRAVGFGMTDRVHTAGRRSRRARPSAPSSWPTLDELLARADVLSLHCPLTPQTRRLIDERRLRLLPRGAILVNTSRGEVVDEEALVRALESGALAGAGLDVYEREPEVNPGLLGAHGRGAAAAPRLGHEGSAGGDGRAGRGQRPRGPRGEAPAHAGREAAGAAIVTRTWWMRRGEASATSNSSPSTSKRLPDLGHASREREQQPGDRRVVGGAFDRPAGEAREAVERQRAAHQPRGPAPRRGPEVPRCRTRPGCRRRSSRGGPRASRGPPGCRTRRPRARCGCAARASRAAGPPRACSRARTGRAAGTTSTLPAGPPAASGPWRAGCRSRCRRGRGRPGSASTRGGARGSSTSSIGSVSAQEDHVGAGDLHLADVRALEAEHRLEHGVLQLGDVTLLPGDRQEEADVLGAGSGRGALQPDAPERGRRGARVRGTERPAASAATPAPRRGRSRGGREPRARRAPASSG